MYHLCTVFFLRCACCVFIVKWITRVFIVHFRLSKILLDLQEDSDVAESDACSKVGSEEDDGVEERLELTAHVLDPLSCQETSENE